MGWHAIALCAALIAPTRVAAQLDGLVPTQAGSSDPIGVESTRTMVGEPELVTARQPLHGPAPPPLRVIAGATLQAARGVTERRHRVRVYLALGLAFVETRMEFVASTRRPREVAYRLPAAPGTLLVGLEVCTPLGCRRGEDDADGSGTRAYDDAVRARGPERALPIARIAPLLGGGGFRAWAAPASQDAPLTLIVRTVVPAPVHHGTVHLALPGRQPDPRLAITEVHVTGEGVASLWVDDRAPADQPILLSAWAPVEIRATMPTGATRATVARFLCGGASCARVHVTAGARPARSPTRLVLLLDASASMEGPPRGRMGQAIAAVLGAAPQEARVQAVAFGLSAQPVLETSTYVRDAPAVPLAEAALLELGPATRFEAAWALARPWLAQAGGGGRIVWIGDGGLSDSDRSRAAFAEAASSGVVLSAINVADRPAKAALASGAARTGGIVIDAGQEAARAAQGHGAAELTDRVAAIFAPEVTPTITVRAGPARHGLGALVTGEQRIWQGPLSSPGARVTVGFAPPTGADAGGGTRGQARAQVQREIRLPAGFEGALATLMQVSPVQRLAAVDPSDARSPAPCHPLGPARRAGGLSQDGLALAVAGPRSCAPAPSRAATPTATPATGLPAESVLLMLRRQVVPAARRCLRRDRAGRADYSIRATFSLVLANRELERLRVGGEITERLRQCLTSAAETLRIPPFSGAVTVRWPIRTEGIPQAPRVELWPDVARALDQATD